MCISRVINCLLKGALVILAASITDIWWFESASAYFFNKIRTKVVALAAEFTVLN